MKELIEKLRDITGAALGDRSLMAGEVGQLRDFFINAADLCTQKLIAMRKVKKKDIKTPETEEKANNYTE